MNVSSNAFEELKTKNEIQSSFSKIGFDFESETFHAMFDRASYSSDRCSINQFRDVMNDY